MGQRDVLRGVFSAQHQRYFFKLARQLLDGCSRFRVDLSDHYLGLCLVGQPVGTTGSKRLGGSPNTHW